MNKTNTPKISIGLPTYNGEKFLCEAIDLVLIKHLGISN